MMKSSRSEDDENMEKKNMIKDIRNLFRLEKLTQKETINTTIKDIRNPFRLKKENKEIKNNNYRYQESF